ncbi:N-acetyl sugar amidotransferase [Methanocalculus sp. MC3]
MNKYQICTRCVMDTTACDIVFDEEGVCNYCKTFEQQLKGISENVKDLQKHRDKFIAKVKADGKNKEYDCIIGVSGGVDSSYALYLAVKHGLRPLAVHLDNGWNSELATHNISNLIDNLGVDLYTHVIDWEENRDLQCSFFKANVVDIELLMDNAMLALNYQQAAKYRLHYILSGSNTATEGMPLPPGWNHFKYDVWNIKQIHKRYGKVPIKTHPLISVMDHVRFNYFYKINWMAFLDFFPYNKNAAMELLQKECGYKPYPYKHYESVFTRFYQGYILPRKFGYDKRCIHLSTLIVSGQIERDEAVKALECSPYLDARQEEQDRIFVLKKLGFTEDNFDNYLRSSGVPHKKYGSEEWIWNVLSKTYRLFYKI